MTQKVFWQDPYLTTLAATVIQVDGQDVQLDQTIFFAFSGGQESDSGTLGGYPVLQARKNGLSIVYTLPLGHTLQAGDNIEIGIDWDRRYRLMRLHFAAEMVLQLVYQHRPGIERIGAHISPEKARIDFASHTSLAPLLPTIQQQAMCLIEHDHPIVTAFSDEPSERRFWRVDGFASMPCGGTHPVSTAEVVGITLKRKNQGNQKERIEITLA